MQLERTAVLNSKLPLWYQIAQSLRAMISESGHSHPLRLPTETQIGEKYGVSVVTVRQALKSLEDEGLISRRRRHGTFVNPEAIPQRPLKLLGSIEAVFTQQASEETELLGKTRIPTPPKLLMRFADAPEVVLFQRLRREQGSPLSYAFNYVRPEYGDAIMAKHLLRKPMTRVLREDLGVTIERIEDTIEARAATPEVARLLGIEMVAPVLFFTGVTFGSGGRVIDVAYIHYRADRYKFSVGFDIDVDPSDLLDGARPDLRVVARR